MSKQSLLLALSASFVTLVSASSAQGASRICTNASLVHAGPLPSNLGDEIVFNPLIFDGNLVLDPAAYDLTVRHIDGTVVDGRSFIWKGPQGQTKLIFAPTAPMPQGAYETVYVNRCMVFVGSEETPPTHIIERITLTAPIALDGLLAPILDTKSDVSIVDPKIVCPDATRRSVARASATLVLAEPWLPMRDLLLFEMLTNGSMDAHVKGPTTGDSWPADAPLEWSWQIQCAPPVPAQDRPDGSTTILGGKHEIALTIRRVGQTPALATIRSSISLDCDEAQRLSVQDIPPNACPGTPPGNTSKSGCTVHPASSRSDGTSTACIVLLLATIGLARYRKRIRVGCRSDIDATQLRE